MSSLRNRRRRRRGRRRRRRREKGITHKEGREREKLPPSSSASGTVSLVFLHHVIPDIFAHTCA